MRDAQKGRGQCAAHIAPSEHEDLGTHDSNRDLGGNVVVPALARETARPSCQMQCRWRESPVLAKGERALFQRHDALEEPDDGVREAGVPSDECV